MWKFERLNFRCQKLLLGLDLLDNCIGNHVVQKRLNYPDDMLPFELLFPDIKTNDLVASQSNFIKSKFLDTAFTSYNFFEWKRPASNLNEAELNVLENLKFVIQKADKGDTFVIINKNNYKTKIKDMLSDYTKFKKLENDENKQLNFSLNGEKKLKLY